AYVVHLYLKDGLHRRLDLGLGCVPIDAEGQQLLRILCFFLGSQRLFSNYGRLDDVPNCSHAASCSVLRVLFFFAGAAASASSESGVPSTAASVVPPLPSNCSSSVAASRESTSVS